MIDIDVSVWWFGSILMNKKMMSSGENA